MNFKLVTYYHKVEQVVLVLLYYQKEVNDITNINKLYYYKPVNQENKVLLYYYKSVWVLLHFSIIGQKKKKVVVYMFTLFVLQLAIYLCKKFPEK